MTKIAHCPIASPGFWPEKAAEAAEEDRPVGSPVIGRNCA
jgi:hypothetical protein